MSCNEWMLILLRRWRGSPGCCVGRPSSCGQPSTQRVSGRLGRVLGLGIDLAADEALNLVPDAISVDGPVPGGDEPASLLRSAEQLMRRIAIPGTWGALDVLRVRVAHLVWEANTSVDG
jgi:hypothetical protein